jgi:hypothetical protein
MSNSRVSQIFKDVFGRYDEREEQEYVPIPSSSSQTTEAIIRPPEDNYKIMYLIFLLQGITMLLGWNVIVKNMYNLIKKIEI